MAFNVDVQCYAGYRDEETPRRFTTGTRAVEVEDVVDRWHGPDHRYFKVRGGDGATYILRHDTVRQAWEVVVYQRDVTPSDKHDKEAAGSGGAQPKPSVYTSRASTRVRH